MKDLFGEEVVDLLRKIETNTRRKTRIVRAKPKAKVGYSQEFEVFWKAFVGRWDEEKGVHRKGGKLEAWGEYQSLTAVEKEFALLAAPLTGGKVTKDACRWLKYKRWTDDEFVQAADRKSGRTVGRATKCESCGADSHIDLDRESGKMLCRECKG